MNRKLSNFFLLGYLLVQIAVPLRVFFYEDQFSAVGDFSWNMYTKWTECSARYYVEGQQSEIHPHDYLNRRGATGKLFFRNVLPIFHEFLCDEVVADGETLRGRVKCSLNGGELVHLLSEADDLCAEKGGGS